MVADTHLDILVHPLVLLNISDYYTRTLTGTSGEKKLAGICLGTQDGRQVSIETTFELLLSGKDESEIDLAFLEARLDQYKQVFPQLEVTGWYTIGAQLGDFEQAIQSVLSTRFDAPLLLVLDPHRLSGPDKESATELPLRVFEHQLEVQSSTQSDTATSRQSFVETTWKLETGEAERIAVDHVSKAQIQSSHTGDTEDSSSALISHYNAQANAVKMLKSRIALLTAYVQDVKDGRVAGDADVLRRIQALLQRMPVMQSSEFQQESTQERSDVLLTKHLGGIMNGTKALSDLIETYATAKSRNSRGLGSSTGWS